MSGVRSRATWRCIVLVGLSLFAAVCAGAGALGTSAAVDPSGRLWIAYAETSGARTHVVVERYEAGARWSSPVRATPQPEPVAADGENRPKIAFGPQGDLYVAWTSPTSAQYTADIRFARSIDGGRTWSMPVIIHRDRQVITHRFESMAVDRDGRIWVAWIDKRDLNMAKESGREYAGAAVYYAYSQDRGDSWRGDFKLADHSCECCRIAFAVNTEGRVLAMWRHVFAGPERDHAAAVLDIARPPTIERATFDGWRVDACPHHGPGLAVTRDGVRHAVWFNQVRGQGRVFYGQLSSNGPAHVLELPPGASHAEIAAEGDVVGIAWKRFDGANVRLESWVSQDAGMTFASGPTLRTQGDSDQPRLVSDGRELVIVWRREEGVAVQRLLPAAAPALAEPPPQSPLRPFERDTLAHIERSHAGEAFWLVLWDMECTYCLKSLQNFAQAQRERPALKVVTVATDSISSAEALRKRLAQIGVVSEAYAFVDGPPEPIRFAIDPAWMGEKPRAYQYGPNGERESISGVISVEQLRGVRSQARLTR